jgi:hypothetical protein
VYNCGDQGLRMSKVPSQRFDAGTYLLFVKKNYKNKNKNKKRKWVSCNLAFEELGRNVLS